MHPHLMPGTTRAPVREETPMSTLKRIIHAITVWGEGVVFAAAVVYSPELAVVLLPPRG